jgi:hypothetical protein
VSTLSGVSACSRAATAEEAAYRIDYPLAAARNTRVVALDAAAEEIVRDAAALAWGQAKFYAASDPGDQWVTMDGDTVSLTEEIAESNTVVMVSTDGTNAEAAATIGAACKVRGIMTAGLVVTPGQITTEALMELRPHARILLVPAEADDLVELLTATRA